MKLDLTQLNILSTDDPDFKYQVLQMLHTQTVEVAKSLKKGLEEINWETVADAAHKFKSSVNLINQEAYLYFKELEREARDSNDSHSLAALTQQGISLCENLGKSIQVELAD